eukprot:TRINITY_DN75697_c0_g1_i1.p1 TRINITY_DN75697_c0_g1~~TRINITY_DN75697_c0_g1_i1.p1  ORF type:complete len:578 (-),score=124.50 TRINITY_DN75697_c0_g1_i1:98-1831(-)
MGNGCLGSNARKVAPVTEQGKSKPGSDTVQQAAVTRSAQAGGDVETNRCDDADESEIVDAEHVSIPFFFEEILQALDRHRSSLGGLLYFSGTPCIEGKVKKRQLAASYSDYEYVYLTILGLAQLHIHCEVIIQKNNGEVYTRNPGVQMLERVTGFTMHANREGSNHVLRTAPACLIDCFQASKEDPRGSMNFFRKGFDRTGDPCLEGRTKLLMEYLETVRHASDQSPDGMPPWEDVSLQALPKGCVPQDVVAEHLRVFIAECTWRWSRQVGKSYAEAKEVRLTDACIDDFSKLFNACTFRAAILARGAVAEEDERQWESQAKGSETWFPYDADVNAKIDQAYRHSLPEVTVRLGPKSWQYVIDLRNMVQRNPKTGQERKLQYTKGTSSSGKLTQADVAAGIDYFVEMCTLPPAPEALGEKAPAGAATASASANQLTPAARELMGVVPTAVAAESSVAAARHVVAAAAVPAKSSARTGGALPEEGAAGAVVLASSSAASAEAIPSVVDAGAAVMPASAAESTIEAKEASTAESASPVETPAPATVTEAASPSIREALVASVPEPASTADKSTGASTPH